MFVQHKDEIDQLYPAHFHAAAPSRGWKVWDVKRRWAEIAFAASKAAHPELMGVASKLSAGFENCEIRLLDLAEAYGIQLRAYVQRGKVDEYVMFSDRNSPRVYNAIHALFWELAVLRDRLAEFASRFCFSTHKVCKRFRALADELRQLSVSDALAGAFLSAADPESKGWVWLFTEYRNFFTHDALLQQTAHCAYAIQDMRQLVDGTRVPQIYYPLPQDICQLRKRSRGARLSLFEQTAKEPSRRSTRTAEPDALEYLHCCLDQYADLGQLLVTRSPIAPVPITLTAEDFTNLRFNIRTVAD
jgi:hypothetical protein